jgi:sensor histidine kinase regulating citrate/malate metabolism
MSLARQVLTLQLALIVVVLAVVAWVSVTQASADRRRTEGGRLLSTAESVAAQWVVRIGLGDPARVGEPLELGGSTVLAGWTWS